MRFRKYTSDFTVFDNIDTEEKSYWLGFLMGDGSVSETGRLRIELSNKDRDHLEKFKLFMKSDNVIKKTRKDCSSIGINSKDFISKLANYGIVPRKTHFTKTPDIDKNLLKHFYRGILDSDGWICRHKHKDQADGFNIGFCSANKVFIEEIKNFINTATNNTKGLISFRKYKAGGEVYQLIFGGAKVIVDIIDFLYDDFNCKVSLSRKLEKAKEFRKEITERKNMRLLINR